MKPPRKSRTCVTIIHPSGKSHTMWLDDFIDTLAEANQRWFDNDILPIIEAKLASTQKEPTK